LHVIPYFCLIPLYIVNIYFEVGVVASESDVVAATWVVGFSGGLDSTVLLHRFAVSLSNQKAMPRQTKLVAVYVNHQLQSFADGWGRHCLEVCRRLNVTFVEVKLSGKPAAGESLEAWARNGRMKAISDEAKKHPNPTILLAHHEQDQVETFIYRSLRGAGSNGLASMQDNATWFGVPVQRPLIHEARTSLSQYAQAQGLKWIDDPSNKDERLARNAIRAQVIPALRKVMPDATTRIANSVQSLADDALVLAEVGAEDLRACAMSSSMLSQLSDARASNALRAWVRQIGLPLPSRAVIGEMLGQLLLKGRKYSHSGQVTYCGWLWTRYRDRLEAAPLPNESAVDWFMPPQAGPVRWSGQYEGRRQVPLAAGFAASCMTNELDSSNEDIFSQSQAPNTSKRSGALRLVVPKDWLNELHVAPLGGATSFKMAELRPTRSLKAHCQTLGIASLVRPWLPVLMYKDTALIAAGVGVNYEVQSRFQPANPSGNAVLELNWRDTHDCRRAFL
jgi:tRNA(Ile)-lysidine synthetase-like protein